MTVGASTQALPRRVLGKTGEPVPVLGLGTGPGGMGMVDAAAIDLYDEAIDKGVTYIDTAPGYARAQAQLAHVVPRRRDELFLVTKCPTSDAAEAVTQLEENLKALGTDAVDLAYVHSLGNQDSPDAVLARDGSLAGLRQAQKRGLCRYVGFTAHNKPAWSARVLREADVDVVMLALNFADHHTYGFDRTVLPAAMAQGTGVAAMKVFGGALDMKYETADDEAARPSALAACRPDLDHEFALRWSLGLPGVHLAVVGMYSSAELDRNLEWARRWQPLSAVEEASLLVAGESIASTWGAHYGAVE